MKEVVLELSQHRDCLVMELQQLQEAKPVLEKAYAVIFNFYFNIFVFKYLIVFLIIN